MVECFHPKPPVGKKFDHGVDIVSLELMAKETAFDTVQCFAEVKMDHIHCCDVVLV